MIDNVVSEIDKWIKIMQDSLFTDEVMKEVQEDMTGVHTEEIYISL